MDKIKMTITSCGETLTSINQSVGTFGDESGVVTLLRLDPESVVEVHKPDGMTIRYEWANQ